MALLSNKRLRMRVSDQMSAQPSHLANDGRSVLTHLLTKVLVRMDFGPALHAIRHSRHPSRAPARTQAGPEPTSRNPSIGPCVRSGRPRPSSGTLSTEEGVSGRSGHSGGVHPFYSVRRVVYLSSDSASDVEMMANGDDVGIKVMNSNE
ncbi:MAG: hypothetical protein ACREBW_08545 [Candidatus Micrarchaeaceae archaeon]